MDEIISYTICAVKVRNAKLRNYLKIEILLIPLLQAISHIFEISEHDCMTTHSRSLVSARDD
jgi:hypothetical protein